jgi:hypothetical protein
MKSPAAGPFGVGEMGIAVASKVEYITHISIFSCTSAALDRRRPQHSCGVNTTIMLWRSIPNGEMQNRPS